MLLLLFLTLAVSADGFFSGYACGRAGVRPRSGALIRVGLWVTLISSVFALFGRIVSLYTKSANALSGAILVFMALFFAVTLWQARAERPLLAHWQKNTLGLALGVDAFAAAFCFGLVHLHWYIAPFAMGALHSALLALGVREGLVRRKLPTSLQFISPALLFLLGVLILALVA